MGTTNAAPAAIGVAEGRQVVHRLAFDVDRLAPAFRILAPIWNKTPAAPDYSSAHDGRAIGSLMDTQLGRLACFLRRSANSERGTRAVFHSTGPH